MLNLSIKEDRENLEQQILSDINAFCVNKYKSDHRDHLGASILGENCYRKLYYSFRWMKQEDFDGRMLRLFQVGHNAEARFIEYLRGVGFEVREFSEDGKQFRIMGANGHYGGSLDGMVKAPERYQINEDLILLLEMKTNNTGAGFNKVSTEHLSKAKPKHFQQMCQYGYKYQLKYGLYLIENKNDSSLTPKIIELDWDLGKSLERKAEEIIFATEPPQRISENPSYFDCAYCHFKGICFDGEIPVKNCRSCRNSRPVENGEWSCAIAQQNIPSEVVKVGCPQWTPI